jgi:hypothetical protein
MNDLPRYLAARDRIQTMDLLQWHGESLISRLIRWKTGGSATHSGIAFRLADVDRVMTLEAISRGAVPNPLSDSLSKYDGRCYWHPLKKMFRAHVAKAFNWMYDKIGTGYDFEAIGSNLFGKVSADARMLFCSEYVFLGWKIRCAEELNLKTFSWLLDIKEVPVPSDLHKIGLYEENGIRIL